MLFRSHRDEYEGTTVWAHDVIVAHVVPDQHHEHDANARLIAAAPQLFEALQEIVKYFGVDVDNGLDELLTNARAAIHKATGQEI